MKFEYPAGPTPLDADEVSELIPGITTQGELNEFEQKNITKALIWAYGSKKLRKELLSIAGLISLHEQMFNLTWKWAGRFRRSDKNIGLPWSTVPASVRQLCDNTQYQIEHKVYDWDELAVRFHHRLVFIHPFVNGNERHARLAADLLLKFNGMQIFSWGRASLVADSKTRREYISALGEADNGNFKRLIRFARI